MNPSLTVAIAAIVTVASVIAFALVRGSRKSSAGLGQSPSSSSVEAPDNPWGIFAPAMLSSNLAYLELLNTTGSWKEIIERMRQCIREARNPFPDIYRLLEDPNWRPNIVGAVALLLAPGNGEAVERLWKCMDKGSWASPQLAAAASLCDSHFSDDARARLVQRCPIQAGGLYREEHFHQYPDARHNAKLASALVRLCELREVAPGWLVELKHDPEFAAFLASDTDRGGQVAEQWLADMVTVVPRASSTMTET